jgi:ubiquinone/menaquinone biosynthesis C-methylase UbiE
MKHDNYKKAIMFNKKASRKKSKSDIIINTLDIKKGNKIADIGVGGGFFTIRFAKIVGDEGHIYAIDTNSEFLKYIKIQVKNNDLKNITTILTKTEILELPEKKLDYIFIRNVYHHLKNRINYFKTLKNNLKKNGEIIIIEHNGKGIFNFNKIFKHYIKPEIIKEEMEKAGYEVKKEYDFITQQSFTIFTKKPID